jgi:hypothetical protein
MRTGNDMPTTTDQPTALTGEPDRCTERKWWRCRLSFLHRWGPWQPWAITYQVRYCELCNKQQIAG